MDGLYAMGLTEMPYADSPVESVRKILRGLRGQVQRRAQHRRGLWLRCRGPDGHRIEKCSRSATPDRGDSRKPNCYDTLLIINGYFIKLIF